jgi:multidrug transporter EmrE-like cation transporter
MVDAHDSKSCLVRGKSSSLFSGTNMKYFFIFLVITVGLLEVVGDVLFKEWIIHNKKSLLLIGVVFYMLATVIWAFSLKYQSLSKAVVIFAVLTLIVGVLVGVFFYKEPLTTLNIIGIVLGLASIVLIEL